MNISQLAKESHEIAVNSGWFEKEEPTADRLHARHIATMLMLASSELVEALEIVRCGVILTEVARNTSGKPEGFPIELADCIIRVLDTAEFLGIDIESAIEVKMEYNKTRPYRHGNKLF